MAHVEFTLGRTVYSAIRHASHNEIRHFCTSLGCGKFRRNLDVQQGSQETRESFVHSNARGGVVLLGSCVTQNGCRLSGLNDVPSGRLVMLSWAYGEGTLEEK